MGVLVLPLIFFSTGTSFVLESDEAFVSALGAASVLVSDVSFVSALDVAAFDSDGGALVRPLTMNPAPTPMRRFNFSVSQDGHLRRIGADMVCTSSNWCPHAVH